MQLNHQAWILMSGSQTQVVFVLFVIPLIPLIFSKASVLIRNYNIFKQLSKFMPDIIIAKPHNDIMKKPVLYQAITEATLILIGHRQNLLLEAHHFD